MRPALVADSATGRATKSATIRANSNRRPNRNSHTLVDIDASFGYWLRRRRKALDLTQEAVAERAGCSVAAIRKLERDERRPSRQVAGLLAGVLEIPPAERERFLRVARGERGTHELAAAEALTPAAKAAPPTPASN